MKNSNSNSYEKNLYETIVKYKKFKFDTKLKITNKRVTLEKNMVFLRKSIKL